MAVEAPLNEATVFSLQPSCCHVAWRGPDVTGTESSIPLKAEVQNCLSYLIASVRHTVRSRRRTGVRSKPAPVRTGKTRSCVRRPAPPKKNGRRQHNPSYIAPIGFDIDQHRICVLSSTSDGPIRPGPLTRGQLTQESGDRVQPLFKPCSNAAQRITRHRCRKPTVAGSVNLPCG